MTSRTVASARERIGERALNLDGIHPRALMAKRRPS